MTYIEHHQFEQIEKTCDEIRQENFELLSTIMLLRHDMDEIRQENVELLSTIMLLRHDMEVIVRLNSLGKTKQIADLIAASLK